MSRAEELKQKLRHDVQKFCEKHGVKKLEISQGHTREHDPVKFRRELKQKMESDPERQKLKSMSQHDRDMRAIDIMTRHQVEHDRAMGKNTSESDARESVIKIAEKVDAKR